jgi:hypothetical protein
MLTWPGRPEDVEGPSGASDHPPGHGELHPDRTGTGRDLDGVTLRRFLEVVLAPENQI